MEEILQVYVGPCICAFMACLGFTFIFHVRGVGKFIGSMGGLLGWLVYLLAGKGVFGAFAAAVFIGIFSEITARLRHNPVTGYVLVSALPLVPGSGIYYSMRYFMLGDHDQFVAALLHTLGVAAALAVGAMLSSSLFRTIVPEVQQLIQRRRR